MLTVVPADDWELKARIALVEVGVAGAALGLAAIAVWGVAHEFRRRVPELILRVTPRRARLNVMILNDGERTPSAWTCTCSAQTWGRPGWL